METVLVALIGAGVLRYLEAVVRWFLRRRTAASPAGQRAAVLVEADQTVTVVAHARDELAEDNRRVRAELAEERAAHAETRRQHAEDLATNRAREAAMRAEIDALELKLRTVLNEVEAFKRRHA